MILSMILNDLEIHNLQGGGKIRTYDIRVNCIKLLFHMTRYSIEGKVNACIECHFIYCLMVIANLIMCIRNDRTTEKS